MSIFSLFAQAKNCPPGQSGTDCFLNLPNAVADQNSVNTIFNIVFGVIGGIAVIIIIVQGIRFVLSGGDAQKAADARKGVIYAAVGLGVAVSAEIIVNLVVGKI